jgi:hypothetical protein
MIATRNIAKWAIRLRPEMPLTGTQRPLDTHRPE